MIRSILILLLATIVAHNVITAQDKSNQHTIKVSGYVDSYFSAYDNDLSQQDFQPFITVGARDNNLGLNVAQIGLNYTSDKIRASLILHYGDIIKATWSPDFNEIQEANVGLKLSDGLWLDAGFFPTHIGTESFLPKNNMLSSTAFKTFNEPFYQAGAVLSYNKLKNWIFQLWLLNGYNSFIDNNDAKSVGVYLNYNLSSITSITYTNLYGRESADDAPLDQNRFYQNIYLNTQYNKWFFTIGLDYGIQTNSDLSDMNKTASMIAGVLTARYQFNDKYSITGRGEIFKDNQGFISGTTINTAGNLDGINLTGFTLGAEYKPSQGSYLRLEIRYTTAASDLEIFNRNGNLTNNRVEVLCTLGLEVEKLFQF